MTRDDIRTSLMSENGLMLSCRRWPQVFAYSIECKNRDYKTIYNAYKHAQSFTNDPIGY